MQPLASGDSAGVLASMSSPDLDGVRRKLSRGEPLSQEEMTQWQQFVASSGAKPGAGQTSEAGEVPGKSTYKMPRFGAGDGDAALAERNAIMPPGSRIGSTGGLLPDQGDAAPTAPAPLSPFDAGQRDRQQADEYYAGVTGTARPGAAPAATAAAAVAKPAPAANPFSQIGARDPNARKPGSGQGTIRRGNEVFGYNGGSAIANEDGSKRNFGTEGAAMDHLDTLRPAAPAAKAGMGEMVAEGAGTMLPNMAAAQAAPASQAPAPVDAKPLAMTTPPPNPVSPVAGMGGGALPLGPAGAPVTDFRGMGGFSGHTPAPKTLPSAQGVAAAPSAPAQPADPVGFPAIPSPFSPQRPAPPIINMAGGTPSPVAGMGDLRTSEGPRTAAAPIIDTQGADSVPGMRHDSRSGKPVPGWAQNSQRSTGPMFPNAIWNSPSLPASNRPQQSAAAAQFNPFQKRRVNVLPE